jgi:hypothetical protein
MEEGVTHLADAGATEELHHRKNDGTAVWLLRRRPGYLPHAHRAARLRVTV